MKKFDPSNFVLDKVVEVKVIQGKCVVCGFENTKDVSVNICPVCKTNLVVSSANISEHNTFCASFLFG